MPRGQYIRTEEMKRNISKTAKERHKKYKHPMLGKKHTQEAKDKISESKKGHKTSEETRKKMSESKKGRKHSEETKNKIRKTLMGHNISKETRMKMGEAQLGEKNHNYGRHFSEEYKKKMSESMKTAWNKPEVKIKVSGKNSYRWNPNRAEVYAPYGENFYNNNIRDRKWKLQNGRDMLTGTILDPDKRPAYHHIDYCKSNDDPDNHCHVSINNHMRITVNRENIIKTERYKRILRANTLALKNGEIPKHWSPLNKEMFRQERLNQLDLSLYII